MQSNLLPNQMTEIFSWGGIAAEHLNLSPSFRFKRRDFEIFGDGLKHDIFRHNLTEQQNREICMVA